MISVSSALSIVLKTVPPPILSTESVPISASTLLNRVLSEDVVCKEGYPRYKVSIVDGYAFSTDVHGDPENFKVGDEWIVMGRIRAGQCVGSVVEKGRGCYYVTTGGRVPEGCDYVVPVEIFKGTGEVGTSVCVDGEEGYYFKLPKNKNVRLPGCDVEKGGRVGWKGQKVEGNNLGLLAMSGRREVECFKMVTIGVMSTGNEIRDVGEGGEEDEGGDWIYDANRPMMIGCLMELGALVMDLGIAKDDVKDLEGRLLKAFSGGCAAVVTTGGASMGDRDYMERVITNLGGSVLFGRLMMKPGKPTTFAKIEAGEHRGKCVFALPGNPCSAWVTGKLLLSPAVRAMQGLVERDGGGGDGGVECMLDGDVRLDADRPEYHRVRVNWEGSMGCYVGRSTGVQRSSRLLSTVGAEGENGNGLLLLPRGKDTEDGWARKGEVFQCILTGRVGGGRRQEGGSGMEREGVRGGLGEGKEEAVRILGGCKGDRRAVKDAIWKVWGEGGVSGVVLTVCDLGDVEGGLGAAGVRDWCGEIRGEGGRNTEAYLGGVVRKWLGGADGGCVDVAVGEEEGRVEVRLDFGGGGGEGEGMEGMWREIKRIIKRAGRERRNLG
ncbi:hypothetical protein TrCOL_g12283 [Triparma columacea]|uniref:MoaB/Mog domain-containing protein n=1 Tax=Triparma columacea TaxID=722753 RepID=A0A9W7FUD5_9STRA|nr:hypothetical protein TrCOL_g12283 [Triparma columacea]